MVANLQPAPGTYTGQLHGIVARQPLLIIARWMRALTGVQSLWGYGDVAAQFLAYSK